MDIGLGEYVLVTDEDRWFVGFYAGTRGGAHFVCDNNLLPDEFRHVRTITPREGHDLLKEAA